MVISFLLLLFLNCSHFVTAGKCSPGFFGPACSLPCRCLDNSCLNSDDSPGCSSGSCSPGYTGFPGCQTECDAGYFGVNCVYKCSCTPKNVCSHINGNCIFPNQCTSDRVGPGCQIVRSKLTTPPGVEVTCTSLTIFWLAFKSSSDVGVADVQAYQVEIMSTASPKFTKLQKISRHQAVNGTFHMIFPSAIPGETYWARIVPLFYLDTGGGDGYLEEGIPSPPSDPATISREACFPHPPTPKIGEITVTSPSTTSFSAPMPPPSLAKNTTGPKNCMLVGLSAEWAVFQWHHGSNSCGLGELTGYELSLVALGSNDGVEEAGAASTHRTKPSATAIVASDLVPATKYRARLFALYEKGSVECYDLSMGGKSNGGGGGGLGFTTFSEPPTEGSEDLFMSLVQRGYGHFVVLLQLSLSKVAEPPNLWVAAFPVKTRLPQGVGRLGGGGGTVQNASGVVHHFAFTSDVNPATQYRLYAWAAPTSTIHFVGVTMEVWTAPKPFTAFPNFLVSPPQMVKVLDRSVHLIFPTVSGYEGGPLTDFFLAVSPGHFVITTAPKQVNHSDWRRRLSLPMSARIVFHSRSPPHDAVVVVGDGLVQTELDFTGGYSDPQVFVDPPLEPNTEYTIFVAVASVLPYDSNDDFVGANFVVSPTQATVIRTTSLVGTQSVASTVGTGTAVALVLLCLVLIVLFFWWRFLRHRPKFWKKSSELSLSMRPKRRLSGASALSTIEDYIAALPRSYKAWSFPVNLRDPRFLVIDPERGPDNTLLGTKAVQEIAETFFREFKSLSVNKALPQVQAKRAVNRGKNRCTESLPFDHNRVHLRRRGGGDDYQTDYVNASYVDSYLRRRAYIIAQSPFNAATASDFWSMVVHCNVAQIVMLENQIENGVVKCTKYWPDKVESQGGGGGGVGTREHRQYDSVLIEADDVLEYAHFSVRRFRVTDLSAEGSGHYVTQYHFHRWRLDIDDREYDLVGGFDHMAFIDFYFHVKMATKLEDGPILAHCEDGVSRSSVFIAFDTLFQQLMHEHAVTVARTCAALRRARQFAVPSARHFALLYDLLFETGLAGHSLLDLDIRSALASLSQRNVTAGYTYLREQWYLLHNYTTAAPAVGGEADNNGSSEYDRSESELSAVWVDGLTVRNDVLLTRAPTASATVLAAFWRLVFQHKISCIVDMEPSCYGPENEVGPFWPPYGGGIDGSSNEDETLFGTNVCVHNISSCFMRAPDVGRVVDNEGETVVPRDTRTWFQLAEFQLAQVGPLETLPPRPVPLSPKRSRRHRCQQQDEYNQTRGCLFKRSIIIRRLLPQRQEHFSTPRRAEFHTVNIVHFKAPWRLGNQVPPRDAMVQAIEVFVTTRGIGAAAVLCMDGATRSGLFLAAYLLAERLARDRFVDLFHTLKSLKMRRHGAVASVKQLRFLYHLLIVWVDEVVIKEPPNSLKSALCLQNSIATMGGSSRQDLSTSAVFSASRMSLDTPSAWLVGTNASNSFAATSAENEDEEEDGTAKTTLPRPVTVLYRYYSEELSRLFIGKEAPRERGPTWIGRREHFLV